ncbi:MAG: S49 family peptidase [Halobacteriaceae archaeon]
MSNRIDTYLKKALSSYAVLALVAALLGATLIPPAIGFATAPDGTVAVVSLDDPITGATAEDTVNELRDIRRNDSIDAVVLRVSSGGGTVSGSEAQYQAVKRLARAKPVVTSVQSMAASGAYYTILPSDTIYVEPSSMIGHVGVIASFSQSDGVPPVMTSGPDKASGAPIDAYRAQLETLKRSFVGTVMDERGTEITLSRTEVSKARIYLGARAVENGYADEIGGIDVAIRSAANEAGLESYETVYRDPASPAGLFAILGSSPTERQPISAFGTPAVHRVRYLALWGTPATATNTTVVSARAS